MTMNKAAVVSWAEQKTEKKKVPQYKNVGLEHTWNVSLSDIFLPLFVPVYDTYFFSLYIYLICNFHFLSLFLFLLCLRFVSFPILLTLWKTSLTLFLSSSASFLFASFKYYFRCPWLWPKRFRRLELGKITPTDLKTIYDKDKIFKSRFGS